MGSKLTKIAEDAQRKLEIGDIERRILEDRLQKEMEKQAKTNMAIWDAISSLTKREMMRDGIIQRHESDIDRIMNSRNDDNTRTKEMMELVHSMLERDNKLNELMLELEIDDGMSRRERRSYFDPESDLEDLYLEMPINITQIESFGNGTGVIGLNRADAFMDAYTLANIIMTLVLALFSLNLYRQFRILKKKVENLRICLEA